MKAVKTFVYHSGWCVIPACIIPPLKFKQLDGKLEGDINS